MTSTLLIDCIDDLRKRAQAGWGQELAQAILAEALSFEFLDGADLEDWPTADLVPRWAWDSRSDELEAIGHNRDAFIRAMGSVRRSQRIRRELFPMATAAALFPEQEELRAAALRYWRAPLHFERWQYPGWTLYYKEHTMPADGDGEWGATVNYLVVLPLCAELLRPWLSEDDWALLRRRTGEFCSRTEDDFYSGRTWFFDGPEGGVPDGNQFTQIIGGFVVGALSLAGHDPRADRWIDLGTEQMLRSMEATGTDGSYFEGAAYGLGTMEQVFMVAHLLQRRGDRRLIDHPQIRNFPYWLMDTFLPDRDHWLPLNDSGGSLTRESLYNRRRNWAGGVLAHAVALSQDPVLSWCLHEIVGGPSHDVFGLVCHDPEVPVEQPRARSGSVRLGPRAGWLAAAPDDIPRGSADSAAGNDRRIVHYPEQGIVLVRDGYDTDSVMVALKGGWVSRGHDHNDRNSILLYDGPVPIISETGPGPYSDPEFDLHFGAHHAHSTIQIDDAVEPHKLAAAGTEGVEEAPDGTIRIVGDASASYQSLSRYRRTVTAKLPDRLEIVDEIIPADGRAHRLAFWFHSHAGARRAGGEGEEIVIPGNGDRSWRLNSVDPVLEFTTEVLGGEGSEERTVFVARTELQPEGGTFRFVVERRT